MLLRGRSHADIKVEASADTGAVSVGFVAEAAAFDTAAQASLDNVHPGRQTQVLEPNARSTTKVRAPSQGHTGPDTFVSVLAYA